MTDPISQEFSSGQDVPSVASINELVGVPGYTVVVVAACTASSFSILIAAMRSSVIRCLFVVHIRAPGP